MNFAHLGRHLPHRGMRRQIRMPIINCTIVDYRTDVARQGILIVWEPALDDRYIGERVEGT